MPRNLKNRGLYVSNLTLENVSCFHQQVEIPFSRTDGRFARWTILLGENGVGKSTALRSIFWMEPNPNNKNHLGIVNKYVPNIIYSEINQMAVENYITKSKPYRITLGFTFMDPEFSLAPEKIMASHIFWNGDKFEGGSGFEKIIDEYISNTEGYVSLPYFGYGANRHLNQQPFDKYFETHKAMSLFSDTAGIFPAETILIHTFGFSNKTDQKDLFSKLVQTLLPALRGIKNIKVEYDPETTRPKVLALDAYNMWVPFSQVSLGHQAMAAWLVDFTFRMLLTYPKSSNPLAEPAVCVVDEIDLHLHPKWQRQVFEFLEKRFPRTQFIVSAHSPLIVLSNPDANFVLLRNVDENDPSKGVEAIQDPIKVEGYRLDQLLSSELFGLQSTLDPKTESEYLEKLDLQRQVTLGETLPADKSERLQYLSDALSEKGFVASSIDPLYNQFVTTLLKRRQQELKSLGDISAEEVDAVLAEILG